MNDRPQSRPRCEHGKPIGTGPFGCKRCYRRDQQIRVAVAPLVDEFWEHRGQRNLLDLMLRAYRMGMLHDKDKT